MNEVYGYTDSHDKVEVVPRTEIEEDYYNKDDVDTNFASKDTTYTKTEVNSIVTNKILSGTTEPSSSLGENGAIYIKYEEEQPE